MKIFSNVQTAFSPTRQSQALRPQLPKQQQPFFAGNSSDPNKEEGFLGDVKEILYPLGILVAIGLAFAGANKVLNWANGNSAPQPSSQTTPAQAPTAPQK
ncbi:MAG: hypothetical protein K2X01_06605 [Cyanobacteria bacterium]|nr:hypothetical protein [Cyanobacteriota bacterium]